MTKREVERLLQRFRVLAIVATALLKEPQAREDCWFQLGRDFGRPLREFLLEADPDEDPAQFLLAIQALEALREEQIVLRRIQEGRGMPYVRSWQ